MNIMAKKLTYLPEVSVDQKYEIEYNGKLEIFRVDNIRATNVSSKHDYQIAVSFKSENSFFDENLKNVIGNDEFKLLN